MAEDFFKNNVSPVYDDVRFSQLNRNSTNRTSLQSSGDRKIGNPVDGKFPHIEGVGNSKKVKLQTIVGYC